MDLERNNRIVRRMLNRVTRQLRSRCYYESRLDASFDAGALLIRHEFKKHQKRLAMIARCGP